MNKENFDTWPFKYFPSHLGSLYYCHVMVSQLLLCISKVGTHLTNQQSANQIANSIKQLISCGYRLCFDLLWSATPNPYFQPLHALSSLLNIHDIIFGILPKPRFEESSPIPVFNRVINPCLDSRLFKHRFNHLKTYV